MIPYLVRSGTPSDIPAITAMYRHDGYFHAQGDAERAPFYHAATRALGGTVLVAVEDDEVVGHLELLRCQEIPPLGRYGYLETLEVRADRRRRGIGRALVEAAKRVTSAFGGERVETTPEDERSLDLYTRAGFRPVARYLDLDLHVPPEALRGAAPLDRPLPPGARPWRTRRHLAGRQYPAAYCWARAYLAGHWALPEGEGTGAWDLPDLGAVVLADPWLVHLFLPPDVPPASAAAWPAWQAMFASRAGRREGYVRTVVEARLAQELDLAGRWPDTATEPFTLLACPLAPGE